MLFGFFLVLLAYTMLMVIAAIGLFGKVMIKYGDEDYITSSNAVRVGHVDLYLWIRANTWITHLSDNLETFVLISTLPFTLTAMVLDEVTLVYFASEKQREEITDIIRKILMGYLE